MKMLFMCFRRVTWSMSATQVAVAERIVKTTFYKAVWEWSLKSSKADTRFCTLIPIFCVLLAKLVPSAQQFFYRWECSMVLDLGTSGLGVTSWRIDITWNICMWVHWRSTERSGGEQKGWEVTILSLPAPDALGKTTPLFTYLNQKSHSIQQQTV